MNYKNGIKVRAGDKVIIDDCFDGVVVFCIDNDEYLDEFPKNEWAYLKTGMMIKCSKYGLVHCESMDDDIEFVARYEI